MTSESTTPETPVEPCLTAPGPLDLPPLLDPDQFKDRDSFICHLMNVCGWRTDHVASLFHLTDRHVRRIAQKSSPSPPKPSPMTEWTEAEKREWLDDYAHDPDCRMHIETLRVMLYGEPDDN